MQDIQQRYQQYLIQNRRRSFRRKLVNILACTVIFCTTYALILPAITMEKKAFCGMEEHTHTQACHAGSTVAVLSCREAELAVHAHSAGCYDAEGNCVCGQADYLAHSHRDHCYDSQGTLVCTLAERSAHVHGDGCYAPAETEPGVIHVHTESCYTLRQGGLTCTLEEYEGHTHEAGCFAAGTELLCALEENHVHSDSCYRRSLTCTLSTDPHTHSGSCRSRGELICTAEEEGHEHSDSCYESVTVCGRQEGDAHTHDDSCFSPPELVCTVAENHVHSDSCYDRVLTCQIPEDPGHSHSDSCYEWTRELTCGLEEGQEEPAVPGEPVLTCREPIAQEHIHGDGCFETVAGEAMPICGNSEEGHQHTDSCYELVCGLEAHTHSLACWSDPEADLETAAQWEATFAEVELTGNWPEDVVAIAETQLGYAESSRNYAVWEDNTTHGYTRYGAWYGSPYGDWCAMFTSFCLHYAQVEDMPLHWGVRPWIQELTELKLYHEAEVYEPKPGDIIFYDWEDDGLSDHVGIVAEILVPEEGEEGTIQVKAIEGNSSNRVQYVYYDMDDARILGYSELPDNPRIYSCGLLRHSHNEYCYDDDGNFICHQLEHAHTEACEPRDALYCGLEEHTHSEECYDEAGALICGLSEHTHNQSCTEETPETEETLPVYFCGMEEHTHGEACYDEAGELVCEVPEHSHSEECTTQPAAPVYHCGMEEHTHGESCYDEAGELVCEASEHTHSEECTAEPIPTYYCGMEEHTHVETCHNEAGELVCELIEHIHTEECEIQPIYYCGLEEHTHVETCYNEAGELVCELTEHTHTEECTDQPVYYCGLEEHTHIETCYDEAGELVCEVSEHTHTEECTVVGGYVCGMEEHLHDENCYDNEGNLTCLLPEHTHSDDCRVQNIYACNMLEHSHGETCFDEAGNLVCTLPEHIHTSACMGRSLYYSDASIRVHAVIRGVENLPEKLMLNVVPITAETHPEAFGIMQSAVSQQVTDRSQYISSASFYNLQLLSEGTVYELPETAVVTVTMEFTTPIFDAEAVENSVGTHAFLLTPEGGETVIPVEGEDDEIPEITPEEPAEPSLVESVISTITDVVSGLIPEASADELEDGEGESDTQNGPGYNVSTLSGENYGNQNQGITSVTFETNQLTTFGVALANETVIPQYWTRVNGTDNLTSGETYLIVSAEGNYALTNESNNYVPVRLQAIRGKASHIDGSTDGTYNNVYYRIDIADNATKQYTDVTGNMLWTITKSGDQYTIQNGTTYVNLGSTVLGDSQNLTLNYQDKVSSAYETGEYCWRIRYERINNHYYLKHDGGTSSGFTQERVSVDSTPLSNPYVYGMLIFKASDAVDVDEPPLVIQGNSSSGSGATVTKPDHKVDAENLSSALNGETSYAGISGTYDSDPATSAIENEFYEDGNYAEQRENDGMVRSDKSVVYGQDDYGALAEHINNTFGVTLSALGQAYPIPETDEIVTPIDAVFVLDTSSSMTSQFADNSKRMIEMTDALNQSITHIMAANPNNRVGVVVYSRGTDKVLPMGRYETDNTYTINHGTNGTPTDENGQTVYYCGLKEHTHNNECYDDGSLVCDLTEHKHDSDVNSNSSCFIETVNQYFTNIIPPNKTADQNNHNISNGYGSYGYVIKIQGDPTLRTEGAGSSNYANAGSDSIQGWGTYTQAGIAMGYEVFKDVTDTTFVTTVGEDTDLERTYYIQRQPVYILLSDGEPTYSTNIYNDVLNGPHYGDGNGEKNNGYNEPENANNKGIHGYYTILSANYYKHMASVHYKKQAKFYTVGMGISATDDYPLSPPKTNGNVDDSKIAAGDNYRRAVLNPVGIESLTSSYQEDYTTDILKDLLLGDYTAQSVTVRSVWPEASLGGYSHKVIPALQKNPYNNYDYSDYSDFGTMDSAALTKFFDTVIAQSQISVPYGFVLYKNTKVEINDYIGAGMEVETDPVLRYNGKNYTYESKTGSLESGTVTYTYNPTNEPDDSEKIQARITTVPFEPIYMCGQDAHTHVEKCLTEDGTTYLCGTEEHTHSEANCGIKDSYLCGEHTHVRTCHEDNDMDKPLTCGFTHDHVQEGCKKITNTQKVELIIPDTLLPLYTPNLVNTELAANQFYYEALPVRLIYRVGLTDDAEVAVLNLAETGGTLTFYSNRWGGTQHARTDLTPSRVNPFYHDQFDSSGTQISNNTYIPHSDEKKTNQTGTDENATQCHWGIENVNGEIADHVYHELGNNGKLTFKADTVDIPVEKKWTDLSGQEITDTAAMEEIQITLYRVEETKTENTSTFKITVVGDPAKLNVGNGWKTTFTGLSSPVYSSCYNSSGVLDCQDNHSHVDVYYAIAETEIPDGYLPKYAENSESGQIISIAPDNQKPISAFRVNSFDTTVTITNTPSVELPETGGSGTTLLYALGALLCSLSCAAYMTLQSKHSKERRGF